MDSTSPATEPLEAVLAAGARAVFQPLVDLDTEGVVGYEALARGPVGSPLERPDALFDAGRRAGRLAELERACHAAAVRAAGSAGLGDPAALFLNVEPVALAGARLGDLLATWEPARRRGPVVLELTERALTAAPAELQRQVDALRGHGFLIALDDVGADFRSLALMPYVRPDVIKLDLRLVQRHTSDEIAGVIHAVWAEAERSGAPLVAEGIETERHAETARAFGASLGQGWRYGRPAVLAGLPELASAELARAGSRSGDAGPTPLELVRATRPLRVARKVRLLAISRRLERQALHLGTSGSILATFEEEQHFGAGVRARYADLAERSGFVGVFGDGLGGEPAPGVRGQDLAAGEPLREEWNVCVIGPHFAGALVARDLHTPGVADPDRLFEYTVTYDRELALATARLLMARIAAQEP